MVLKMHKLKPIEFVTCSRVCRLEHRIRMGKMSNITLYKGHYPNRDCLASKQPETKFMPGDSGLLVDVGHYQVMIPFDVIEKISQDAEAVFDQYPGLRPKKESGE